MRVRKWNDDKPHRCPECHAVTDGENRARWAKVKCCACDAVFTRWPRLAPVLPYVGVVCDAH